jgi:hypothetical protein
MVPPEPPEAADPQEPSPQESAEPTPAEAKPAAGPPAPRSNVRLLIAIGLALLVLVGGGVTIIALASNKRPEDTALQQERAAARIVVERFAVLFEQARNDGAFAVSQEDVKSLLCAKEQEGLDQEWQERIAKEINRSSVPTPSSRLTMTIKDIRIEGDAGVAKLVGTQDSRGTDQDFGLVKENAQWKVCGVVFRTPKSSSSSATTAPSSDFQTPGTTAETTTEPTTTPSGPTP